jgi:Flp pilus assembly protein protease CpaA
MSQLLHIPQLNFLFWFFLCGLIVASIQDIKRTEVDDWLNFLLFTGGVAFIVFSAIFQKSYLILLLGGFSFFVLFLISELIYRARIFAGGDYKLLIALFAVFVGKGFLQTSINIGVFLLILLICGSLWGLFFSFFIYARNFSSVNGEMKKFFKMKIVQMVFIIPVFFLILTYFNFVFFIISIFLFFSLTLFIFVKSIENKEMIKGIDAADLREGDWLVHDVIFRGKRIKAGWEGVSRSDLKLLKNYKGKIKIKQGIPFVPSFFLAFILFWMSGYFIAF